METIQRLCKLVFCTFILVCIFTKCNAQCTFAGNRTPRDLTRLQNLQNKRFSCEDTVQEEKKVTTYEYTVGICTTAEQPPASHPDAGVIQVEKVNRTLVVIGKYKVADLREGDDWLMLEYYEGDSYGHHCNGSPRTAVIMIQCTPGEEGKLVMLEESNEKDKNCFYLFELKTKYGCSSQAKRLSVGSIIVIVLLSLVAVYLFFGLLFQRFVKGAKGLEQIPNYTFWRDAGNLAADGCDLVFRSHSTAESREYRGVGGETLDQEITRDTNNPDDHLLSM